MPRLVILGGNAAGMSAAAKAKRRNPELETIVLEMGDAISYSSCGIPYLVEGAVEDGRQLLVLSPEEASDRGIDVRMRTKAVAFNPYTKEVVFQGPGGRDSMHYDKLLVATGTAATNPFPGGDLPGVFTLRHVGDGLRLMRHLEDVQSRRVAVVGGGFIGLEMAAAFQTRGAEVHLLQRGPRLMTSMDPEITDGLDAWLREAGIHVHLGADVEGFAGEGQVSKVLGPDLDVDTVLVATGVKPNTEFAIKAGISTLQSGHILVDDQMRTNLHDVYAAGDCVAPRHIVTGRPTPMPLALPANRMGRVAGDAIAASLERIPAPALFFPGVLGTVITRIYGLAFAQTGLTEAMAKAEGMDTVATLIETKDRAGYMPDAADMAVKMVADRHTGKILGVQLAGPETSGLRIDAAAVAIQAGMTAKKLSEAETAYAPPFSTVHDPLVVAAEQLAKQLKR